MPLSDFLSGYFETCLDADEILTGIEVPAPPAGGTAVYLKHDDSSRRSCDCRRRSFARP